MEVRLKQRAVIEFLVAEGCEPKEIHARLKNVYGDETIDISNVRRWVVNAKKVNSGSLKISDLSSRSDLSGRPKTAVTDGNVQKIDDLIHENRRITQHKIARIVGISKERVNHIISNELEYRKICARWVPRMLTDEMKKKRLDMCKEILTTFHY
ncbi:GVQW3 protein, partial [Acromyrmex insinuator]